jgi:hypothetical protein
MKYVFSLHSTTEDLAKTDMEETKKEIAKLIEQVKPEAMYFSTIRRLALIVVNVKDPHVELRNIFESLSRWGKVTIDPVSTFEEFGAFLAQP